MKKMIITSLLFILIFISGCSNETDFSKIIYDEDQHEKNVNLIGKEIIFENGYFFISDSNNQKIRLMNCENKYNIKLSIEPKFYGFLSKQFEEVIFYCGKYDSEKNISKKEFGLLLENISLSEDELNKINTNISNKKLELKRLNESIEKKKILYQEMLENISFIAENYTISQIKQEITSRTKYLPNEPLVKEYQLAISMKPEEEKNICNKRDNFGKCTSSYEQHIYYKNSQIDNNYGITIYANKAIDSERYYEINIEVTRKN